MSKSNLPHDNNFTPQELRLIRDALKEYKFIIGKASRHYAKTEELADLFDKEALWLERNVA
jgi:hypothetical protein